MSEFRLFAMENAAAYWKNWLPNPFFWFVEEIRKLFFCYKNRNSKNIPPNIWTTIDGDFPTAVREYSRKVNGFVGDSA